MDQQKIDTLEINYVDAEGLASTMNALADICYAKAVHIRESYQDSVLANEWESLYRKISTCHAVIQNDANFLQGLI